MDLDKFGEIIDNFIKENHVQMLIEMPEGTLDPIVKDNIGAGSVMKFYFLLNAISAVGKEMKKEMGFKKTCQHRGLGKSRRCNFETCKSGIGGG